MSSERTFELLKEVSRLLVKYGPDTFDDLARYLANPGTRDQLLEILRTVAVAGRKSKLASTRGQPKLFSKPGADQFLGRLAELEPEKSQLLSAFRDDLMTKNVLPSLRDLKSFASDNGLIPPTATSRDKAIEPLIKSLSHRTMGEVEAIIQRARVRSESGDRTLEGWADIILKRPPHGQDGR